MTTVSLNKKYVVPANPISFPLDGLSTQEIYSRIETCVRSYAAKTGSAIRAGYSIGKPDQDDKICFHLDELF